MQYGGATAAAPTPGSRPGTRGASAPVVGARGATPAGYPRGHSAGFSRQIANPTITRTTDTADASSAGGLTASKLVTTVYCMLSMQAWSR